MISENLSDIYKKLPSGVKLVAVSKYHTMESILLAYQAGQRDFGESRPQELAMKALQLPQDINWHFIGHLQTNKLNLVLPYTKLIHSVDSVRLLWAIENWCEKKELDTVDVLLELHLGSEPTKQGFYSEEIIEVLNDSQSWPHIRFRGLMGMATNTDDEEVIASEFAFIQELKNRINIECPQIEGFTELSIGMSDDMHIAVRHGATMVRVGSKIFGERQL